ncbi:MAG: aldehyde dehydrogenase family protein [Phyllobacteriaceae bacterium]|nr:aldehyde dehydrogenase family protein [Phyllobacteriaceae bacterium]
MSAPSALAVETHDLLATLGVDRALFTDGTLVVTSPIDGAPIGHVMEHEAEEAEAAIGRADAAFRVWRMVPPPKRGELVHLFGEELRAHKAELGRLVTIEAGKIVSEGLGEVQEMIDICDFAVGLSRQLYGVTLATERPAHRMMETWHPIGPVGVISAFNFPVSVWSWNAGVALVCGDPVVWKPSEKTPLTALAVGALFARAVRRCREAGGEVPDGLLEILLGAKPIGEILVDDPRVPVVSATGSTTMGRSVAPRLAKRFARAILELGGNNAAIVCPTADLDLALRAIAFSAIGTAGQRCTSLRRLFVHDSIYDTLVRRLRRAYGSVTVGDPSDPETLVGPLIDPNAGDRMKRALDAAREAGGTVTGGERVGVPGREGGVYMAPALVEMPSQSGPVPEETFAPILYVMRYTKFETALKLNNAVVQGLSSAIFTNDLREAELFVSAQGSDCGIANVNIGPSGAEIGGAFGGEKETGGGREAGSDAWKAYMRRATNTINYGRTLPLAQGVKFDVES